MQKSLRCALVGAVLFSMLSSVAMADAIVAPAGTESALESGLNTAFRSAPRAYEEYIAASNFSSITQPVNITGIQLRLAIGENWRPVGYVGQTWPSQNLSFTNWDLQLSKPSAGLVTDGEYLSTSPTFASYQDGGLTTVRSGALNIAAGAFLADGLVPATDIHSWGPLIPFTTPYAYTPGDGMVLLLRHSGYTPATELNAFFGSRSFQNGVTDAISNTTSQTAASPNGFSSPFFVQFTFAQVPEPTSIALLGIVGLAVLGRSRSR
jgi:hypothetical protein